MKMEETIYKADLRYPKLSKERRDEISKSVNRYMRMAIKRKIRKYLKLNIR